jgi:hypothetical protein
MDNVLLRPINWYVPLNSEGLPHPSRVHCVCSDRNGQRGLLIIDYIPTNIVKFESELSPAEAAAFIDSNDVEFMSKVDNSSNATLRAGDEAYYFVRGGDLSTQTDQTSVDVSWSEWISNSVGNLSGFFEASGISPYQIINVTNYKTLEIEGVDIPIICVADIDVLPAIPSPTAGMEAGFRPNISRLYWDIEAIGYDLISFPDANRVDDEIFMISAHHEDNHITPGRAYLLYIGDIGNYEESVPTVAIKYEDEVEEIKAFFQLIKETNADRTYSYNGETFDNPYIVERMNLFGMKQIPTGRDTGERADISLVKVFGLPAMKWKMVRPGVSQIDVIKYFRRFHPYLHKYKLDYIGEKFVGERKTDIPIMELLRAYKEQDIETLGLGAQYSIQDSVLLGKVVREVGIDERLELLANNINVSIEDLIDLDEDEIIKRAVYSINPLATTRTHRTNVFLKGLSQKDTKKGFFESVEGFDISSLYLDTMDASEDPVTSRLSALLRSGGAPPTLIRTAYLSEYTYTDNSDNILVDGINEMKERNNGNIIYFNGLLVKATDAEELPFMDSVSEYISYLSISSTTYVGLTENGIVRAGNSAFIKPKYGYAKKVVDNYIESMFYGGAPEELPNTISLEDAIITMNVKASSTYRNQSSKLALVSSLVEAKGINIAESTDGKVTTKYVMILPRGSYILAEDFDPAVHELDIGWYQKDTNKIIKSAL